MWRYKPGDLVKVVVWAGRGKQRYKKTGATTSPVYTMAEQRRRAELPINSICLILETLTDSTKFVNGFGYTVLHSDGCMYKIHENYLLPLD